MEGADLSDPSNTVMVTILTLPRFGLTMEEGTISSWNIQPGEEFNEGDILYEVETDKTTLEVEADRHGFLREILPEPLATIPVGAGVAIISDEADEPIDRSALNLMENSGGPECTDTAQEVVPAAECTAADSAQAPQELLAVPRARKLAEELGVDLAQVQGSGPQGRISAQDVERYHASLKMETPNYVSAQSALAPVSRGPDAERTLIAGSRKIIGQRLTQSKQEIPHGYCLYEVDMSCLMKLKKGLPYKATISDLAVYCLSRALEKYRGMNDMVQGDYIIHNSQINIGFAMDNGDGLIVPVIRDASNLSLAQIVQERQRLVKQSGMGRLSPADMEGGTITVSNLGMFGTSVVIPIINPPQGAIIGMGEIRKKVVVLDDDTMAIRPMMWLTLSGDHRLMDGVYAARFMQEFVYMLEKGISDIQ